MAGVQCPYTASNCPLFNPIFTESEVLAARSPRPQPPSQSAPTTSDSRAASPTNNLNTAGGYTRSISPSEQMVLPPISSSSGPRTTVAYTDYSLAPSGNATPDATDYFSTSTSPTISQRPTLAAARNVSNNSSCDSSGCGPITPYESRPTESACAAAHKALQARNLQDANLKSTERDMEDLLGVYSLDFGNGFGGDQSVLGGMAYGNPSGGSVSSPESQSVGSNADEGDEEYKPNTRGARKEAENQGGEDNNHAQEVTPFISKLSHLLSHGDYAEYIRWNAEGTAFIFSHTSSHLLEIFGRFFRHANVHSFVRQLNIYGFSRLSTLALLSAIDSPRYAHSSLSASDFSGFSHPLFFRDSPGRKCELEKIKPKITKKETTSGSRKSSSKRKSGEDGGGGGNQRRRTGN